MKRCLMRGVVALLAAGALSAVSAGARAEDATSIGQGPRVFSIQPRPYRLGHEFQLGAGVLPLNAFYVGLVPAASYTYNFTDFWAWEIASVGYSWDLDTSLESDLKKDYGVQPVNHGGDRIHLFGTTNLVIKPLFGKLAIFNHDIVSAETYFVLGGGPLLLGKYWRPAVDVGFGLRFWSSNAISMRLDVRDYFIFAKMLPEQSLFIMVSAAFNFATTLSAPVEAGKR
jgi:outer membrane beta-barrel protein